MEYPLKYGTTTLKVSLDDRQLLGILGGKPPRHQEDQEALIRRALQNPIGAPRLGGLVRPGQRICIVVSDITRAWQRMNVYLPLLVEELESAGVKGEDIFFLCATGTHRGHTPYEQEVILGPRLFGRYRFIDHNCYGAQGMVYVGTTMLS